MSDLTACVTRTLVLVVLLVSPACRADEAPREASRPNVLFLAVDDMKDWVNCLGGYEGTVHTPHVDRLAARGMLFTNAHCVSPLCAPSRAAILTGRRPSSTGLYGNGQWWRPNYPDLVTLPMAFGAAGYETAGAGKIFHHTAGNNPPDQWDDFQRLVFRNDPWFRGATLNYPWSKPEPSPAGFPFSGVEGLGHENDWGSLAIDEADYDDARTADYAVRFLRREHDRPFLLACGLFRPHLPWYVPQEYFDRYPLDEIVLPPVREDDLEDVPPAGRRFAKSRRSDLDTIRRADRLRHAVRAYLASITFADAQLGRVLDALDDGPHAADTIVVLWSDHGWHLGEKEHWHKGTLWEEATRVPLIIDVPELPNGTCDRPVSLLDLYPTLVELCGLDGRELELDGESLVPLLRDPKAEWNQPSVTEYDRGNAAVRTDRFRLIRYADGSTELYDHEADPHEWTNLAGRQELREVEAELARWLPSKWAEPAAGKGAFRFDPETYTWEGRTK